MGDLRKIQPLIYNALVLNTSILSPYKSCKGNSLFFEKIYFSYFFVCEILFNVILSINELLITKKTVKLRKVRHLSLYYGTKFAVLMRTCVYA